MNRNELQAIVLALMIINIGGQYSNTYGLCKVLAWRFKIINCHEITKMLVGNNYVEYTDEKGLWTFSITTKGFALFENYIKEIFIELLDLHKSEEEILVSMHSKFLSSKQGR